MNARATFIRDRALNLRKEYGARFGGCTPDALPLDDLAEQVCELSAYDDPALDRRINGELNVYIGTIRLRPGMPPTRRRFVIAHELGHWALEGTTTTFWEDDDHTVDERPGGDLDRESNVLRAYNTRERHEQEANLFALELLIPATVLWHTVTSDVNWTIDDLAARFGVSPEAVLAQLNHICCRQPGSLSQSAVTSAKAMAANDEQRHTLDAKLPLLVEAGPGTGKTRSIVAKYVQLVDRGIDPAKILALTFSNKAAEEMRERITHILADRPTLAGRVEITTFHAWGLNFLREFGKEIGLPLDITLRDRADLFVLLSRKLAALPLHELKMLHDPVYFLGQIMDAISRAKDELCGPADFRVLADAEAERLTHVAEREQAGRTTRRAQDERDRAAKHGRRLQELAAVYAQYQRILEEEHVLDYGDLLMRAVEALRRPGVATAMHQQYAYILVDEFQDINYASGELIHLLVGGRGCVWAVGDPWQSIYRFRGASPTNLAEFDHMYPGAQTAHLRLNYRSYQPILEAAHAIMAPDQAAPAREQLHAARSNGGVQAVVEWVATDEDAELAALAHDLVQRMGGRRLRLARCAQGNRHPSGSPHRLQRPPRAGLRMRRPGWGDHAVLCRSHREAARVTAVLEAHGIPVEATTDIYARGEVKDALAIAGSVRRSDSAALLRVLSMPEYGFLDDDLSLLVRLAAEHKQALARAARNDDLTTHLSSEGQAHLRGVLDMLAALSKPGDAWQVLSRYLWGWSQAMRERLRRAGRGDIAAHRELAALGHLLIAARNFVEQALPAERGAAAFVDYLRELIAAREVQRPELGVHGDAVRVMSAHAAKGLEFRVVYVPFLRKGRWPAEGRPSSIPPLPAMLHGEQASDIDEERYLLYVAMTRAQDRLVLSRALSGGDKPFDRSTLLAGAGETPPWLVRKLAEQRPCAAPSEHVRLRISPALRMPVAASSIDTYGECPRRYLYQYGYQLYDDLSPYLRMHQAIRQAVDDLSERGRNGVLPADEQALRELVWSHFSRYNLPDELYSSELFEEALAHARQLWNDLRGGVVAPADIRRRFEVRRPTGVVAVTVDRVEADATSPRWIRVKSGQAKDDDMRDTRIILYMEAYAEAYDCEPDVALHYTRTGEVKSARPAARTRASHLEKIDMHLAGIGSGQWQPHHGHHCAECPFVLICPM